MKKVLEIGQGYVDYTEWDQSSRSLVVKREYDCSNIVEEAQKRRNAYGADSKKGTKELEMRHVAFIPPWLPHRLHQEGKISNAFTFNQYDMKVLKKTIERDYPHLKTVPWRIA